MDKELKDKWVAALRSGEYKQTKGKFHDTTRETGGYCCLGVLCEVAKPEEWDGRRLSYKNDFGDTCYDTECLTPSLIERWKFDGKEYDLMYMNDGIGPYRDNPKSFSVIADYIEKEL